MSATSSSGANSSSWPCCSSCCTNGVSASRPSTRRLARSRVALGPVAARVARCRCSSAPGVRVDGSSSDTCTGESIGPQLAPQALGDGGDRGLGRGVHRAVGERRERAVRRRRVHHVPGSALLEQHRDERVDAVDHAEHVDVDGPAPVVDVVLPQRAVGARRDRRRCCTRGAPRRTGRAWRRAGAPPTRASETSVATPITSSSRRRRSSSTVASSSGSSMSASTTFMPSARNRSPSARPIPPPPPVTTATLPPRSCMAVP